jgi:putative DNA primase/helicase
MTNVQGSALPIPAAPLRADYREVERYLTTVYGGVPGLFSVWSVPAKGSGQFFATDPYGIATAAGAICAMDAQAETGIYARMTTVTDLPEEGRGGVDLSSHFLGFWTDLDFASTGHKGGNLPPSPEAADAVYEKTGLPAPSIRVMSGGGLYHHVLLDMPLDIRDPALRAELAELSRRWQALVESAAKSMGYAYGRGVGDLARILRVPGTVNRKDPSNPRMATATYTDRRYTLPELRSALEAGERNLLPEKRFIAPEKPSRLSVSRDGGTAFNGQPALPEDVQGRLKWLVDRFSAVPEGGDHEYDGRNHALNKLAGFAYQYAYAGQLDPDAVTETFREAALESGLERFETESTLRSARRYGENNPRAWEAPGPTAGRPATPGSGQQPGTTDNGGTGLPKGYLPPPYIPDEVVDHLLPHWQKDGHLTLRDWRSDYLRWRTTHWRRQDRASIRAEVYPLLKGKRYQDAQGITKNWAATRAKVADFLEALDARIYLDQDMTPGSYFDGEDATGIIAMQNGLLNMRTRELLGHTPRFFNISSLPFAYDAEAEKPAEFWKFLTSLWENDQQSIQTFLEWVWYVLSGRTDLQKMLLLIGPKRSGKGTLARIMTALVGKENVGGPSLADFGKQFGLEDLVDKPLAIIGDARMPSSGEREILGNLLSISGEDTIRADRKHRDAWVGRLPTRITILSNELPSFADSSGAIASRFIILRMTQSFIGREDKDLEQRLMAELPGIFNMVLDAGEALEQRGHLVEPDSSETARSILSDTTAPIEVFLEECFVENPDPEAAVKVDWIFWAWEDWSNSNGRGAFIGTREGFAKRLLSARPGVRRTRPRVDGAQVPHYQGVLLNEALMAKYEAREFAQKAAAIGAESGLSQGPSWGHQPTFPQVGRGELR